MAELYEDWLVSKMTRAEYNQLSDEEKKERRRLKNIIKKAKHSENNPNYMTKWREEHKEELKERNRKYNQTPAGKKSQTISCWVTKSGLQESDEDLDRIYELYLHQELCNACDVV